jgi:hypothetical protein
LTYQTGSVGYGELVEFFYRTHDPTTVDRQGPDRGSRKLVGSLPRNIADVLRVPIGDLYSFARTGGSS